VSAEENKILVRRAWEAIGPDDLSGIDEVYDADCLIHETDQRAISYCCNLTSQAPPPSRSVTSTTYVPASSICSACETSNSPSSTMRLSDSPAAFTRSIQMLPSPSWTASTRNSPADSSKGSVACDWSPENSSSPGSGSGLGSGSGAVVGSGVVVGSGSSLVSPAASSRAYLCSRAESGVSVPLPLPRSMPMNRTATSNSTPTTPNPPYSSTRLTNHPLPRRLR
jgi:hypothetical protein